MRMVGRTLKQKLMLGVAVIAVLAGVTAAVVMASQSSAHRHRASTLARYRRARRHGSGQAQAASDYLGLSRQQLRTELRSGKTLAQIASATRGKSEAGLIEALVAAKKTALQASVTARTITQADANARLSKFAGRLSARVKRAEHSTATG
jgi:hypothetical protein